MVCVLEYFKGKWEFFEKNVVYYPLNIISLPLNINKGSFIDINIYKDGFKFISLIYM